MAAWLRVLANPKILGRFLRTPAGRRAVFKYGSMVLKSKTVRNGIKRVMTQNPNNKKNAQYQKQLDDIQSRLDKLEAQFDAVKTDPNRADATTFAAGRLVVEMRQLYNQMQADYARMMHMNANAHTR